MIHPSHQEGSRFIKRSARGHSQNPIPLLRERVIEMAWRALYAYAFSCWMVRVYARDTWGAVMWMDLLD